MTNRGNFALEGDEELKRNCCGLRGRGFDDFSRDDLRDIILHKNKVIADLEEHAYGSASWIENLNKGLKKANEVKRNAPPKESEADFRKRLEEFDKDKDAPTEAWGADELDGGGVGMSLAQGIETLNEARAERDKATAKMTPEESLRAQIRQSIATFGEERAKFFNDRKYEKLAELDAEYERVLARRIELAKEQGKPINESAIAAMRRQRVKDAEDFAKSLKGGGVSVSREPRREPPREPPKEPPIVRADGSNAAEITAGALTPEQKIIIQTALEYANEQALRATGWQDTMYPAELNRWVAVFRQNVSPELRPVVDENMALIRQIANMRPDLRENYIESIVDEIGRSLNRAISSSGKKPDAVYNQIKKSYGGGVSVSREPRREPPQLPVQGRLWQRPQEQVVVPVIGEAVPTQAQRDIIQSALEMANNYTLNLTGWQDPMPVASMNRFYAILVQYVQQYMPAELTIAVNENAELIKELGKLRPDYRVSFIESILGDIGMSLSRAIRRAQKTPDAVYNQIKQSYGGAAAPTPTEPKISPVAAAAAALQPVRTAIQNGIGDAIYGKSDDPKKQKKGLLGISEEGKEESQKKVMKNIVVPIAKTAMSLGKSVKDIANMVFNKDQYDADMKDERIKRIKRDEAAAGIVRDKENPSIIVRKPAGYWTAETTDPTEEAYNTKRITSRKPEDVFYIRVPNPLFAAKLRPSFKELANAGFVKQVGNDRQIDLWTGVNQFNRNEDIDGTLKSLHDDPFIFIPENRAKEIYGKLRQVVVGKEDEAIVEGYDVDGQRWTKGNLKTFAAIDPKTLKGEELLEWKRGKLQIDTAGTRIALAKVNKDIANAEERAESYMVINNLPVKRKDAVAYQASDRAEMAKMRAAKERLEKRTIDIQKGKERFVAEDRAFNKAAAAKREKDYRDNLETNARESMEQQNKDTAEWEALPVAEKIAILEKALADPQNNQMEIADYTEQIEQLRTEEASEKVEEQAQGSVDLLQQAQVVGGGTTSSKKNKVAPEPTPPPTPPPLSVSAVQYRPIRNAVEGQPVGCSEEDNAVILSALKLANKAGKDSVLRHIDAVWERLDDLKRAYSVNFSRVIRPTILYEFFGSHQRGQDLLRFMSDVAAGNIAGRPSLDDIIRGVSNEVCLWTLTEIRRTGQNKDAVFDAIKLLIEQESRGRGGAKPTNPALYAKAKAIADKTYSKPSAYKSGFIVKKYKEMGGEYEDEPDGKRPLERWFKEDWKDVGNKEYPVYRPTKRISKDTPLTPEEIDPENLKLQVKEKQKIKGERNLSAFQKRGGEGDEDEEELEGSGSMEYILQKAGLRIFNPSADFVVAGRQSFTPDYDAYGATVADGRKNALNLSRSMYDQSKAIELPDFKLMKDDTSLRFYRKDDENVILVGIRGTDFKSWTDFYTWFVIGTGSDLRLTTRFMDDLAKLVAFQRNYPPSQFYYVATGHSLAGSIIDRFLEMGLIEEAITYNPSIEKKHLLDENILNHRVYLDTDPLFILMGQYAPNTEIRVNPNKTNYYNPSKEKDYLIASHLIYPVYNPALEGGGMEGSGKTYTIEEWKAIFDAKLEQKRKAIEAREAKKKQTAKAKRERAKVRRDEREKPKEPEEDEPEVEVEEYEMGDETYLVEEPREGLAFADRRVFDNDGETLGNLTEDDVGKTLVKMVMRREKLGAFADKSPKAKSSSESLPFFESQQRNPAGEFAKTKSPKEIIDEMVEDAVKDIYYKEFPDIMKGNVSKEKLYRDKFLTLPKKKQDELRKKVRERVMTQLKSSGRGMKGGARPRKQREDYYPPMFGSLLDRAAAWDKPIDFGADQAAIDAHAATVPVPDVEDIMKDPSIEVGDEATGKMKMRQLKNRLPAQIRSDMYYDDNQGGENWAGFANYHYQQLQLLRNLESMFPNDPARVMNIHERWSAAARREGDYNSGYEYYMGQ